ncbi:unnamed protein product [Hymenolepis diminuta]|uniref:PPP4R2 domain-containing protein n=1 Tax=Hymenolepis diminuta TaxID=6216 RepID=A0A564YMA6_HYMDI|nr:unnamed protein product [Hymenolepis diminuta]
MTLLDMENKESILAALNDLEPDGKPPAILDEYLREIAKHGLTFIPWIHIKPLILLKFNYIMDEYIEDVDGNMNQNVLRPTDINDLRERVYRILCQFEGTPFTIQRICELLSDPRKHYSRPDKFLRGFEKVCLVVSTVDAYGNKIHNVEPRLSGTIERCMPFVLNGTSGESGLNEDSPGRSKRSEDGEEEDNEDITSPRRPCINFYRRPTSKLVDGLQKSFGGDSLIGAYSPGIPGKHTLQRPFLSGRGSSAIPFNTIFEDSEASGAGAAEDDDGNSSSSDDGGEEMKQEKSECEGSISDEGKALSTSESTQRQRPLTGIQKLFMENEEDDHDMVISPVPSIEQMLRPMGQLEAFVNTISMVTASPTSSSLSHSTTGTSDSPLLKEPPPSPSSDDSESTSESEEKEVEIPITEIKSPKEDESESKEEQKGHAEEGETPLKTELEKDVATISVSLTVIRQPSLKRLDSDVPADDNAVASLASPAKRMRFDSEQEFTDIEFSETTPVAMDYDEESSKEDSPEQSNFKEDESNEVQFSSNNSQCCNTLEEEQIDQEYEASSTVSTESQDEQEQPHTTVDSDTGEKERLK